MGTAKRRKSPFYSGIQYGEIMTVDEQARTELKAAWEKYKTFEPAGLEFGEGVLSLA